MKRPIAIALAITIPVVLFFAAHRAAGKRPLTLGQERRARTVLISRSGTRLFTRSQSEVQVWDIKERTAPQKWKLSSVAMVPSADGERVVVATSPVKSQPTDSLATTELSGSVRDARTGKIICEFRDSWRHPKDRQDALQYLNWSADDREIAILTNSALRIFNARDGSLIRRVPYDARNGYTSWKLSPDSSTIVATDRKGAHFFSASTGKETRFWKHPAMATYNSPIAVRAVSPGGKWAWMEQRNGPNNNTEFFVRASDGKLAWRKPNITTSTYGFEICGFSSDGQLVLSLEDARIVARHSASGEEAWHIGATAIQNATLSPDGQFVYSVDAQGIIRRWNVP